NDLHPALGDLALGGYAEFQRISSLPAHSCGSGSPVNWLAATFSTPTESIAHLRRIRVSGKPGPSGPSSLPVSGRSESLGPLLVPDSIDAAAWLMAHPRPL